MKILILMYLFMVDSTCEVLSDTLFCFYDREIEIYDVKKDVYKSVFALEDKNYIIDMTSIRVENDKLYIVATKKKDRVRVTSQERDEKVYRVNTRGNVELLKNHNQNCRNIIDNKSGIEYDFVVNEPYNNYLQGSRDSIRINDTLIKIEKGSLCLYTSNSMEYILKSRRQKNEKVAGGCYDLSINQLKTKVICSYYKMPGDEYQKSGTLEYDLLNAQKKLYPFYGRNPVFSKSDEFILYRLFPENRFVVYNVKTGKTIKLKKSRLAFWM